MKLLNLNREVFIWLNLYPTDRFNCILKYSPAVTAYVSISILMLTLISSVLFFAKSFDEGLLDKCLQVLFQCDSIVNAIYMWIVTYCIRSKLINIFTRFQEINDTSTTKKTQYKDVT